MHVSSFHWEERRLYWLTFYNFSNFEVFSFFLANNISEKSGKINTLLATAKMFWMSKRTKMKYSINVSWPGWLFLVSAQAGKQSIVKSMKAAIEKCSLKLSVPKKWKNHEKKFCEGVNFILKLVSFFIIPFGDYVRIVLENLDV